MKKVFSMSSKNKKSPAAQERLVEWTFQKIKDLTGNHKDFVELRDFSRVLLRG